MVQNDGHDVAPERSRPAIPGGLWPWLAAGTAMLAALVGLIVVMAVLGAMSENRPAACGMSAQGPAIASADGQDAIPPELTPLYQAAAARYRLGPDGWLWLAAINRVETDFGRNLNVSGAGAIGWMQFMPATWATYGMDADGDGRKNPWSPADAIFAAASYLHASGAPGSWPDAIFAYNHAGWYVTDVTQWHDRYSAHADTGTVTVTSPLVVPSHPAPSTPSRDHARSVALMGSARGPSDPCVGQRAAGSDLAEPSLTPGDRAQLLPGGQAAAPASAPAWVRQLIAAGNRIRGIRYSQAAPHGTPYTRVLDHYDCSSSIAFMLFRAGQIQTATGNWVSGTFASSFGRPGTGRWMTIRANGGHVYMYVAGLRWDTHPQGPSDRGDPGIGWHTATRRDDTNFTARTTTDL